MDEGPARRRGRSARRPQGPSLTDPAQALRQATNLGLSAAGVYFRSKQLVVSCS
jgi:hypothetical protein